MNRIWEADPSAGFARRLGKPAALLDPPQSGVRDGCPEIWAMDNGDVAVIGRDLTDVYRSYLPDNVRIADDERLVIIPGNLLSSAKPDIADA
ncbi:hypothetical protein [Actinokineospora cianjurensis]|uniref:Uncharacterized protein n=1 Tax=Actinokineospora cianjurensis TaxID=585224 RepID=A0A421BC31_9PSEU|nr:hypothetical protein [Actinokineospora cianjurensis]RLK61880.1 hypothetical protein CLV68_2424 [Actinokineospora cianjurensis]